MEGIVKAPKRSVTAGCGMVGPCFALTVDMASTTSGWRDCQLAGKLEGDPLRDGPEAGNGNVTSC